MKKFVFLILLSFISAHAINCMDVLKSNTTPIQYQEYKADSGLTLNVGPDYAYPSVANLKWFNNDSVVGTRCLEETCWTYSMKYETFQDESKNITTENVYYSDTLRDISTYYKDLDSIATISLSYSKDPNVPPDTDNIELTFTRNDTIFNTWMYKNSLGEKIVEEELYIVFDSGTNKCKEYEIGSNEPQPSTEYYIETTTEGFILYTSNLKFNITGKMYYSLKESPMSIRKTVSKKTPMQFHYFDLLGRPTKKEHILKVTK